jgi:hypothetical protein
MIPMYSRRTHNWRRTLYLAVPQYAYEDIFTRQVGRIAIEEFDLQLIIFSDDERLLWKRR